MAAGTRRRPDGIALALVLVPLVLAGTLLAGLAATLFLSGKYSGYHFFHMKSPAERGQAAFMCIFYSDTPPRSD